MASAFITGIEGPALDGNERAFLRDADPWGLILFKRNVETPGASARPRRGAARDASGATRRC